MAVVIKAGLVTSEQRSHSKKKGGKKSRSSKAEGVAVKGHLKTRVNTIACFIACVHCLFNTCCGHMDAS